MKKTIISIAVLGLFGCKGAISDNGLPLIDLVNARYETVRMSRLFSSIEYVRLETAPECLIDGKQMTTWVTEDYIVIADYFSEQQSALLFDRTTGKFIKKIATRGRGPGEYLSVHNSSFDEENLMFYFESNEDWMGVDIETDERTYIQKPRNLERSINGSYTYQPFGPLFPLKDGNFVTPMTNITGTDSIRLVVFDWKGTIVRTYPNYQTFVPEAGRQSIHPINANLYYKDNELYFYEQHDDTLYVVHPEKMIPRLVFNTYGKRLPYDPSLFVQGKDYYWTSLIKETDDYVFFNYYYGYAGSGGTTYAGYYDKEQGKTFICSTLERTSWGVPETVYVNDIDGLFNLSSNFKINAVDEIYKPVSALGVVDFMKKSTETGADADNLREVSEDDNPVIVVAKLKI